LKTGLGQDAWNVWGLKPLSKQYGRRFSEIHSGNRRSCPESWTFQSNQFVSHQGRSTHESAPALKGTRPYSFFKEIRRTRAQRLFQWQAENGQTNFLFTEEKIFTMQDQYNDQNKKIYAQTSLEVHSEAITLPTSLSVGRCPIREWHVFIFARKGWNWCPNVSRRRATRSCEIS